MHATNNTEYNEKFVMKTVINKSDSLGLPVNDPLMSSIGTDITDSNCSIFCITNNSRMAALQTCEVGTN
jgi:hypothetical protein